MNFFKKKYLDIKAGDLVQLKSGGPIMTVSRIHFGRECECVWFDERNKAHFIYIFKDALDVVTLVKK